jgi:8-oxo-dGTP diphosphatase
MENHELLRRSMSAAAEDLRMARVEFDDASGWLAAAWASPQDPLAVEVWVFDASLCRVLLVRHRWRGWVPPGGKVEPGRLRVRRPAASCLRKPGLMSGCWPVRRRAACAPITPIGRRR